MDGIDRKILDTLKKDSRTPFLRIARTINVSEGTVRQRVKRFLSKGIIKKFTIQATNETTALIQIETTSKTPTKKISLAIISAGARTVYEVTGDTTIIAFVSAENMAKLNEIIEKIRALVGVTKTKTFPILREYGE